MKHLLKNALPIIQKYCFFWQKKFKNGFHLEENIFLLKLVPLTWITVSNIRKESSEQKHTVPLNKFPLAGMRDSLKNMFSLEEILLSVAVISKKKLEGMVFTS